MLIMKLNNSAKSVAVYKLIDLLTLLRSKQKGLPMFGEYSKKIAILSGSTIKFTLHMES